MLRMLLSDNTATNMLIDLLGLEAINATIRNLGLVKIELRKRLDFAASGGDVRNQQYVDRVACYLPYNPYARELGLAQDV